MASPASRGTSDHFVRYSLKCPRSDAKRCPLVSGSQLGNDGVHPIGRIDGGTRGMPGGPGLLYMGVRLSSACLRVGCGAGSGNAGRAGVVTYGVRPSSAPPRGLVGRVGMSPLPRSLYVVHA